MPATLQITKAWRVLLFSKIASTEIETAHYIINSSRIYTVLAVEVTLTKAFKTTMHFLSLLPTSSQHASLESNSSNLPDHLLTTARVD